MGYYGERTSIFPSRRRDPKRRWGSPNRTLRMPSLREMLAKGSAAAPSAWTWRARLTVWALVGLSSEASVLCWLVSHGASSLPHSSSRTGLRSSL